MPSWLSPVLIVVVVAVLVAALDVGRRDRGAPRPDDVHWFAGVIYFNRDDKRVVVPKRYGVGFGRTLNFAHPLAWIVVIAPLVVAAVGSWNHRR